MTLRLVATDLDGTFFGHQAAPTARTVAAVNALAADGVTIVAATGRSWFTGIRYATATGAHLDWFIGANGGHRVHGTTHEVHERLVFSPDDLHRLLDALRSDMPDVDITTEHVAGQCWDPALLPRLPPGFDEYPTTGFQPDDVGRILLIAPPQMRSVDLVAELRYRLPDEIEITSSSATFVEVTPSGADKGSALGRLCRELHIDRSEVIAFGDNHNDLTMLEWAGRSVAMGNAEAEVKAAADEVAASNLEDGVAQVLETLR